MNTSNKKPQLQSNETCNQLGHVVIKFGKNNYINTYGL